ncbi:MAG: hypothetical protein AB7G28_02145 [Pirellulales bacterium]
MARVSNAQILAERALEQSCGQQCVDWAVGLIEEGHAEDFVLRLAGMLPPYNHFEIKDLRDKALAELRIDALPSDEAVTKYVVEILQLALSGGANLVESLALVKELCIANGYQKNIMDFYLLFFAYEDLQSYDTQWYWDGAEGQNIQSIIRDRATAFLEANAS